MRWDRSGRHVGQWWLKRAILPHFCVACEHVIWFERMYLRKPSWPRQWKCAACIAMEKLREEEDKKDNIFEDIQSYINKATQAQAKQAYPHFPAWGAGGSGNVGQAPQNSGIATNTIQTTLQQSGPQATPHGIIPQAYSAATIGIKKARKAAK